MTVSLQEFRETIKAFFDKEGRSLPWRETHDPYKIMVSELMLQQTQVNRVIPKYEAFLEAFPTVYELAEAPVSQVLTLWQGLGYNRRALNLQRAAKMVADEWSGEFPSEPAKLQELPGIGRYTAGAISAFAFNRPVPFIETNIRRVYIHFFFEDGEEITDKELWPLIEETVDRDNPRDWYYALMDYGSMLGRTTENANRRSKHYTKQSAFKGSNREVRGRILAFLVEYGHATKQRLLSEIGLDPEKIESNLQSLGKEGFIVEEHEEYHLPA